jgi:hypothetical protein
MFAFNSLSQGISSCLRSACEKRSRHRLSAVAIAITFGVMSPTARAVTPTPDGGYPGNNTAEGQDALFSLTANDGYGNTAVGYNALYFNTTGDYNTASGTYALYHTTTGASNTASGNAALNHNTTGGDNTANGSGALAYNTTGGSNTATGFETLINNTTGANNIAIGNQAGVNLTTGNNNIDVGALGTAGESNTIRIGKANTQKVTFIQGISGAPVPNGVQVVVNPAGKLGTVVSSARYKEEIKPMEDASEALLALKPVTFRYKKELDPDAIPQFGLVAEEVERVNRDLVTRDENGKVFTVRYEAVNAMLLNEFLKEHRRAGEQARKLDEQGATIAELKKQVRALTTGLEKVSARVEAGSAPAQFVAGRE